MTTEEKAKRYDAALERANIIYTSKYKPEIAAWTKKSLEAIFPELAESKDERIRKALIRFHQSTIDIDGIKGEEILAWLEKQGNKSVNIDIESMLSSYKQRLKSQGGVENSPIVNMCLTAFRHGVETALETIKK